MDDFRKAVQFVLEHEVKFRPGHYGDWNYVVSENVAGDSGGLTKYGIDQRSHPTVDINGLTKDQAERIYFDEYWVRGKCQMMPWPVSLAHFDACVNTGISQAARFLQRVVGATADGIVGPKTISLLKTACDQLTPQCVAEDLVETRKAFYKDIALKNEDKRKFLEGWLNRITDIKKEMQIC